MDTARSVPVWHGKTPDTPPPDRVRVRVFDRVGGRCHRCRRKINAGDKWVCEHLTALINGGLNAESNLGVTCEWCLPVKNAQDVAEKSKVYKRRKSHLGIRKPSRLACSKDSPWKKKLDGTVVRR